MARRRPRKFRAASEVRAIARERVGAPPPSRPIPGRLKKAEKHKKKELEQAEE